jgi:hypothetical protein
MYAALTLCCISSHLLRVTLNAQGNPDQLVKQCMSVLKIASGQVKWEGEPPGEPNLGARR